MPTSSPPPPPQRCLFVDDDPAILSGLGRLLRPHRQELVGEFVGSGSDALARLALESFDIVVTDMRMPGMDGAALLEELQRSYPHVIRIALSGHSDVRDAMRAVPVAHQFLAKPCDASTLKSVLLRAAGLHRLLRDRELQTLAAGMRDVPARPKTYTALAARLADPKATAGNIADLIVRDVALSANLLRIVNSAFFGLPRRVTSIESAVSYLGTTMLGSLILANAATTALGPRARKHGYDLQLNESYSLLSANVAMQLFDNKDDREDAFAAALLQNVGELLLVAAAPERALAAFVRARETGVPLEAAERELGVVSHAHVGAYLLGAWGLPYSLVEAVAHHHEPLAVEHDKLELVDAAYLGGLLADHCLLGREDSLPRAAQHLEHFGAGDRLSQLQTAADQWRSQDVQR
ncbi:MAG: HDOD domain-containing protein [Polyangiales bacterium]